jgi:hypothetical protein
MEKLRSIGQVPVKKRSKEKDASMLQKTIIAGHTKEWNAILIQMQYF